mgnify:CR=1 FL=1|jgi:hypothetical protein
MNVGNNYDLFMNYGARLGTRQYESTEESVEDCSTHIYKLSEYQRKYLVCDSHEMDHVMGETYVSVEWLRGSNVGIVRAVLIINRILKHEKILTRQELDACSTRLRHRKIWRALQHCPTDMAGMIGRLVIA